MHFFDGVAQDYLNSIAYALELLQSWAELAIVSSMVMVSFHSILI